ncbi:ACT domain-containing protein [Natronorubrum halophilum]|uniref:hypothetical protein n=1 Tax=Natronorubrum halophilum TaxID=1702106 RepID=UPI000EF6AAF6|nr:hypothetical protein [Natronorubrum halophilum]
MAELSGIIAGRGDNIQTVEHVRSDDRLDVGEALLTFLDETSGGATPRRSARRSLTTSTPYSE